MNDTQQQYAYAVGPGDKPEQIHKGQRVVSFRGEEYTFEGVARPAYGNSSGRVAVSRPCPDASRVGEYGDEADCLHSWHRDGIARREFFPSVFDLYLGDENGEKA